MTDQQPQPETQSGECKCGAAVSRTIPPGRFGEFVRNSPFICEVCQQKAEAEDAERQARQDAEWRAQEHRQGCIRRLRSSGLPAMLSTRVLDDLAGDDAALTAAKRWVAGFEGYPRRERDSWDDRDGKPMEPPGWSGSDYQRRGLLLTGNVGVGKTTIAAAAVRDLANRNREIRWLSAPVLFAKLGASFGSDERERIIAILTGRQPLVIDDLDKVRPTDFGAENVFIAIDTRVSEGVPLLVTTNLALEELAQKWAQPYGEAIASRLLGYCEIVDMRGQDRRAAA